MSFTPARFACKRLRSTSRSPGTRTEIGVSSAINITFLRVIPPSYPPPNFAFKSSTRVSIVGVLGESKTSRAATPDASLGATTVVMASTFAA